MSRIGKLPVHIVSGVTITVDEHNVVTVKGPKGELTQRVSPEMILEQDNGVLTVKRPSDDKQHRALHGLTRSLINNMVVGVSTGFEKKLEIVGTGYRAQMDGKDLVLNVGYSHPVRFAKMDGIEFETPAPTKITVKGIDKQKVGQVAADIRKTRAPEPYKGKGIRYEGEFVRRKEGKTGK
ncbi:MAG: 50S ribosomal protein L6 [Clostridia bacterium]|jgi:large subunit ribosomal protein L6|nr:50S ribosomal protein L6 [Clostridia bacterium]